MKDKWDLRFIYKDEAAFEKDLAYIKEVLTPKMASFQGKLQDEKAFSQFLALERESQKVFTKLYLYAGCASDQNKKDVKANERHDLSKLSPTEFWTSAKYYAGNYSPVYKERMANHYFSRICQHHTRRNPHHWEYWTDFFNGRIVMKTMPYKWACEYVCDMLSASKTYDPKHFKPEVALAYFRKKSPHYYMVRIKIKRKKRGPGEKEIGRAHV